MPLESNKLVVLSLLSEAIGQEVKQALSHHKEIKILSCVPANHSGGFRKYLTPDFWSAIAERDFDIVLLQFDSESQQELDAYPKTQTSSTEPWPWNAIDPTVIATITDSDQALTAAAAQYDFSGILVMPLDSNQIIQSFDIALRRHRTRRRFARRYEKIVALLKRVNGEQKRLRQKVDLVCQDLVQSNIDLARSISSLREAYEFQMDMTGEFDIKVLLHKALAVIRQKTPDTGLSIYLCQSRQFEAHIVSDWFEQAHDLHDIEFAFYQTILPVSTHKPLLITDAGTLPRLTSQQRQIMANLSVLAMPLRTSETTVGVLFLYRQMDNPVTNAERLAISTFIAPLSRSIESLQRLNNHLAQQTIALQ